MERDGSYADLLKALSGKRVLIWTCNTCARICNNIGGQASAESIGKHLSDDGIEVAGIFSVSASCMEPKIVRIREDNDIPEFDVILALTCDIGSACAGRVLGRDTVNPVVTLGPGYVDGEGTVRRSDGSEPGPMMSPFL